MLWGTIQLSTCFNKDAAILCFHMKHKAAVKLALLCDAGRKSLPQYRTYTLGCRTNTPSSCSDDTLEVVFCVNFQCTARLLMHVCAITVQSIKLNGDKCGQVSPQPWCDFMPEEVMKTQQKQSYSRKCPALVACLRSWPGCVGEEMVK